MKPLNLCDIHSQSINNILYYCNTSFLNKLYIIIFHNIYIHNHQGIPGHQKSRYLFLWVGILLCVGPILIGGITKLDSKNTSNISKKNISFIIFIYQDSMENKSQYNFFKEIFRHPCKIISFLGAIILFQIT